MDGEEVYPPSKDEDKLYLGMMVEFYSNGKYDFFYAFSDDVIEIEQHGNYTISSDCKIITLDDDEYKATFSKSQIELFAEEEVIYDDDSVKTETYKQFVFRKK